MAKRFPPFSLFFYVLLSGIIAKIEGFEYERIKEF